MFCFGLSKDLQTFLLPMIGEGFRVCPRFQVSTCLGVQLSGFLVVWVSGGLPGGPCFGSFNDQKVRSSKKSISVQFSRYILVIKTNICEVS